MHIIVLTCHSLPPPAHSLKPSEVCGPYQGYNRSYDVIGDLLDEWEATGAGHVVKVIIEIITSAAFMAFLLIGLW